MRVDTTSMLWVRSYDGSPKRLEVRVRAEDFSWDELVEWTRLFLLHQGEKVLSLEPMGDAEIDASKPFVYGSPESDTDDHVEDP